MATASEDLFKSILKVANSQVKPEFSTSGVKLQWDIDNQEVTGTFTIPLKAQINPETGQYILTPQDFLQG